MRFVLISLSVVAISGCTISNSKTSADPPSSNIGQPVTALAFQADRNFGKALSNAERRQLSDAELQVLNFGKAGVADTWKSRQKNGTVGTVTASGIFRVGRSNCRQFKHMVTDGQREETVRGTACKRTDGGWRLVS